MFTSSRAARRTLGAAVLAAATLTGFAALPAQADTAPAASTAPGPGRAASDAHPVATWHEDLAKASPDDNTTYSRGTIRIRDRAARRTPEGGRPATAVRDLPERHLTTPATAVHFTVTYTAPQGSGVTVEARGRRGDGRWTEWQPADASGTARLGAAVTTVQARLILVAGSGGVSPAVTGLSTTADATGGRTMAPHAADAAATPLTYRVHATREGLVGGRTANGHVIQSNDHFVALPSGRALSGEGGTEYSVRVCKAGTSTCETAPVWDIGPWNVRDDYWNPSGVREEFSDLAQGTPEAQAAYDSGYNGGRDDGNRSVLNNAGIDLGDGVAADLGLGDGGSVDVSYLWTDGGSASAPYSGLVMTTAGDFNGDGRTDLVGIDTEHRLWLYPGTGTAGTYGARVQLYGGSSWNGVHGLAAGDFNGDGKADLMAVWSDGTLHLYTGNGDGTVDAAGGALYGGTTWTTIHGLAAGDFNGDGKTDLMAVWSDGTLHLYTGTGTGNVNAAGPALYGGTTWAGVSDLTAGDFTGDGKADLAGIWADGTLHTYRGNGSGDLTGPSAALFGGTTWSTAHGLAAGDFDGDGRTDLSAVWYDGTVHDYAGNGDGTIAAGTAVTVSSSWQSAARTALGDFDGDGRTDMVALDSADRMWSYPGLGNGRFGPGKQLSGGSSWHDVKGLAAGDFNGDGRRDLMVIWSNGTLHLYAGDGKGDIGAAGPALFGGTTWSTMQAIAAGDFNGDGKQDLMAVWKDGSLHLYTGNGDGTINAGSGNLYGGTSWTSVKGLTAADFDGDGKTDLMAIWSDGSLHLYTGTGAGNVNAASGALFGGTTWATVHSLAAGDLNGDGKADLLAAWSDSSLHDYAGNGDGTVNAGSLVSQGGW
ncbi:VCBS repeat-containing protein [Streptomyces sp. NPDC047017]|uniref:FG-GAP repeat domain-containing protein n=1 Tax=Streptomyces sp. NPDC047017 TaxID=3155024 RepID=UPI003410E683